MSFFSGKSNAATALCKPDIDAEYNHSLRFRVPRCCHSNDTRAPIANPPNSARLEGTPILFLQVTSGSVKQWGMRRGTDRYTHKQTDRRPWHYRFRLGYTSSEM